MSFIKDWWNNGMKKANGNRTMQYGFIALVVAIIFVIIFCGIKGNNQDNFWNRNSNTVLVVEPSIDTTSVPTISLDTLTN